MASKNFASPSRRILKRCLYINNYHVQKWLMNNSEKKFLKFVEENNNSYGTDYKDLKFLVMQPTTTENVGLCCLILYCFEFLRLANKHKYIPIVDFSKSKTIYNDKDKDNQNIWELFLKQPTKYSIKDISKAKFVCYVNEKQITNALSFYTCLEQNKKSFLEIWKETANKSIHFTDEIELAAHKFIDFHKIIANKTLVILARGTDYTAIRPIDHPIPPTVNEIIKQADKTIKKYNLSKIFLLTEDMQIQQELSSYYGKMLIKADQPMHKYHSGFLGDNQRYGQQQGMAYMTSLCIAQKCNYLVCANTCGSVFLRAIGNFKYIYCFKKGYYLKEKI